MLIDVVIVSNAKTCDLHQMTQNAITSCIASEKDIDFNIIVIEQNKKKDYKNAKTIHYDFDFNYNKCLNLGISKSKGQYVALCNNDLRFYRGWATSLIDGMKVAGCQSGSPFSKINPHAHGYILGSNYIYCGHRIGMEFLGWCILCRREVFDIIGGINEDVEFWFSDNIFAEQQKKHGIKHCLVCNSRVDHLDYSNTLKTFDKDKRTYYEHGQKAMYQKALKKI